MKTTRFRPYANTRARSRSILRGGSIQAKLIIRDQDDPLEHEADAMAEQVVQRQCSSCEQAEKEVQVLRKADISTMSEAAPSISDRLKNHTQNNPLSPNLLAEMSQALGNDFSDVRIHHDGEAVALNQELNAEAFTVGSDIYFNENKYQPHTLSGKRLLAHELTHVIQQKGRTIPQIQRQSKDNPLDEKAKAVIAIAADTTLKNEEKAVKIVKEIIATYYSAYTSKIKAITFKQDEPGLGTSNLGSGEKAETSLVVGQYFLDNTTNRGFARRVLQVGHELQHVDQYRASLVGDTNKSLREFLAFYWEALAEEKQGTGRMNAGTRTSLIDAALGYYEKLNDILKKEHLLKKQELDKKRSELNPAKSEEPKPVNPTK